MAYFNIWKELNKIKATENHEHNETVGIKFLTVVSSFVGNPVYVKKKKIVSDVTQV